MMPDLKWRLKKCCCRERLYKLDIYLLIITKYESETYDWCCKRWMSSKDKIKKGGVILKKLKIYIDTSAIGYLDEHENHNDMKAMLAFWDNIKKLKYDVIISELT